MLGDNTWVAAVSIILWSGIFFYLLYLHRKIRNLEEER
ncbi:MAG: CcmD family protein [Acidobacteriota bacterium]